MTTTPKLTEADLRQFTGTEHYYRHSLNRNVLFTDGAKYLADTAAAYWLLDDIALAQFSVKRLAHEPFQAWKLSVPSDRTATLTCEDGNFNLLHNRSYGYTDFPLDEVVIWYSNGVLYLPSEH